MHAWRERTVLAAALCSGAAGAAQPPAVLTTFGDGDIAAVLDQPDVGLPAPAQAIGSGFGSAVDPHGLDFLRAGEVLIADFTLPQLARLRIGDAHAKSRSPDACQIGQGRPIQKADNGRGVLQVQPVAER